MLFIRESDEQLKVVGRNAGTKVTVSKGSSGNVESSEIEIPSDGAYTTIPVTPNEHVHLSADNPIMVAQFIKGLMTGAADEPDGKDR